MGIKSKKSIFLTGANGQLGAAIKKRLQDKYEIYCIDISVKDNQVDKYNLNINVSDKDDVRELFKSKNPDILINNAGISVFSNFLDRTEEELDHVYNVNIKGTINMINEFARHNKNNKSLKNIVNIGSVYGIVSADPRIYTDTKRNSPEIYAATKSGIIQLTRYYCVHLSEMNIRVNSISPGGIYNPDEPQGEDFIKNYSYRCPMKKMGTADDVANGVSFLVSDASSYINGHNLVIDGGFTAW